MKAIIVDDEPLALEFLEFQIKKISDISIVKKLTHLHIHDHIELLRQIDLVFLDIEMPGKNGLELAEQLLEINPALSIVFVTAFHQYAVHAFDLNALDYILKPVQTERLQKTIDRIQKKRQEPDHSTPLEKLKINLCKELTIEKTNGKQDLLPWRTSKAQELFIYLLHHRGKSIQKYELIEILWPDFNEKKAFSQLYTTIYHIRKTLRPFNDHIMIKNVTEGYILLVKDVTIDVAEWQNKMRQLPPLSKETVEKYESAMARYTGPYLQNYDYLWAVSERHQLEQRWIQYARKIANFYDENFEYDQAITWYLQIIKYRPEDEQTRFQLMKIYALQGSRLLVQQQYVQLKMVLEELDLEVSGKVRQWHENWSNKIGHSK